MAGIIVACGTVHTFLNYIPSALVGAPDDNGLALLRPQDTHVRTGHWCCMLYPRSQMGLLMPASSVADYCWRGWGLGLYETSKDILTWLLLVISIFLILTKQLVYNGGTFPEIDQGPEIWVLSSSGIVFLLENVAST